MTVNWVHIWVWRVGPPRHVPGKWPYMTGSSFAALCDSYVGGSPVGGLGSLVEFWREVPRPKEFETYDRDAPPFEFMCPRCVLLYNVALANELVSRKDGRVPDETLRDRIHLALGESLAY